MVDFKEDLQTCIDQEDVDGLCTQLQRVEGIPDGLEQVRVLSPQLVHFACQNGHTHLLEILSQFKLDISETKDCLINSVQLACQCNQLEVLKFLHHRDIEIFPADCQPWHDNSPIYIACKHGHKDVVDFLIDNFPSIVKKEDVRSVLLYAACLGGNRDIVKKFFSPGMDINHFVQMVRRFTICEKMTPLYAACSGGHSNIVQYLSETADGLHFPDNVCREFPDIIGQFLVQFFKPVHTRETDEDDDLFQLHAGDLQNRQLFYLHGNWLMPYLVTLVDLDISQNSITKLPSCLPWKFQNLKILNASHNLLKTVTFPETEMNSDDLECCSLEEMNLSHNNLQSLCMEVYNITSLVTLNLSHNKLEHLSRSIHQHVELQQPNTLPNRQSMYGKKWTCSKLKKLLVSHNVLEMLPIDLKQCTSLVQLVANNNNLITFSQPWMCPLEVLNLADNHMERFPTNIETFWSCSLQYIKISNNRLDAIDEGIVKLNKLSELDASRNQIERLPRPEIWACTRLHHLNLKHNRLGLHTTSPRVKSFFRKSRSYAVEVEIAFPSCLSHCLKELRLADNNLDSVPKSIFSLLSLEVLDLSDNPLIKTLPQGLGRLQNLGLLKMKNVNPKLPDHIAKNFTAGGSKTHEMLTDFLDDLRESKPCYKVKAIVLGKKDKGKTTLVNLLANKNLQGQERKSIVREEITLVAKKDFPIPIKKNPDIQLNVWDISGDDVYTLIYHSMFTRHSLYIIVWDFWSITEEIDKIRTLVNNIQASTSNISVVLVGTFLDRIVMSADEKASSLEKVSAVIREKFEREIVPYFCPVSCINKEGIDSLKTTLYEACASMTTYVKRKRHPLMGRKVPKSYLVAADMLEKKKRELNQNEKPLCLTRIEFMEILENVPSKDFDLTTSEESAAVTKFLVEKGYLLHFADQLGALDSLYFLDPSWLCDILVHVLISPGGKKLLKQGQGKISRDHVQTIYRESRQFPSMFIEQYLELLERFELAASTNQGKKLFFPSQLPKDPPMIESRDTVDQSKIVRRLYCMTECPNGFWTRLLTRMMMRIEQFSQSSWTFKPAMSHSLRMVSQMRHGSRNKTGQTEYKYSGLHLENPTTTFCREWMRVNHRDGSFCVEPVTFSGDSEGLQNGILITDMNKNKEFGIMGIIVDEIEDIVQDFYPGLLEIDSQTLRERLERYAVCPTCYSSLPLPCTLNHFSVEQCAKRLVEGNSLICPKGAKHDLDVLVPDLLMKELPKKFFMESSKLELVESKENMLGGGVAGAVYRGKYDGQPVAVKIYRSDIRNKLRNGSYSTVNTTSSDSGTATLSTQGSLPDVTEAVEDDIYANVDVKRGQSDKDEMECIKAFRALRELRQEVAITSRFRHPCIVSLIGLSFSPKLMIALELVPLGSLRSVLDKQLSGRPSFNTIQAQVELRMPLFEKELNFKFVHQIAKGLDYLHNNGIVYKDLKSDNILTMSLELDAPVNLKLSDYGISKYSWGGRSVGLVGTMGYQAPEILEGVAYDEKVDIFSFSMVIYEILTGKRPYAEYENMSQITKALNNEGKRPRLKDLNVHTRFPYLEGLMMDCWHHQSSSRPPANIIVSKHCMQNLQFLSQSSGFNTSFDCQCVLGASEREEKTSLWIWEGEEENRKLTVLDPDWSSVQVERQSYPGPRVICVTKVDDHVWVGNMANEIEVYSSNYSELKQLGTFPLDGLPLQMVVLKNSKDKFAVYVSLEQGLIMEFKNKSPHLQNRDSGSSGLIKKIIGYTAPSTLTLRNRSTHCIGLAEKQKELWVSNGNQLDIIDCGVFKVDGGKRVNLYVLLTLCQLPKQLFVDQIACGDTQVFCLLSRSPFILEFSSVTHTCISILNLDKQLVFNKVVTQVMNFTSYEIEAYRGAADGQEASRQSPRTSCESTDDDDLSSPIKEEPPIVRRDVENTDGVTRRSPVVPPRLPSSLMKSENSSVAPPVHQRKATRRQQLPSVDQHDVDSPIVRPRPGVPEVPPRQCCSEVVPPDRPPRSLAVASMIQPTSAPERPPGLFTMPSSGSRKPLESKNSCSLPIFQSAYDCSIICTSLSVIKDTLWVGRSSGDICIVNILEQKNAADLGSHTNYGKVIADMYDLNNKTRGTKSPEYVKLLPLGKYVMAAYTLANSVDSNSEIQIASWDRYTFKDVDKAGSYWGQINHIEKQMAQGQSQSNSYALETVHSFDDF